MWPLLLDMSKIECKKTLRNLELEAYSMIVTAFRAQGDLTQKKIDILKELQLLFKISIDRHKSELRRACNDDKLYTIAKLLSHGDCVSSEWLKQSKRTVPLLPSLQNLNSTSCYYRILADQILSKAEPVFSLYPEDNNSHKPVVVEQTNEESLEKNLIFLKNGYAVDPKYAKVENTQPSEFVKKIETESSNSKTFLNFLIQKFKSQQQTEADCEPKREETPKTTVENELNETPKKIENIEVVPPSLIETTTVNAHTVKSEEVFNPTIDTSVKPQTLIPIQIPIQIQTPNIKINPNQMIKLNPQVPQTPKTPKILIPTTKTPVNPQKLIILPSNSNSNGNLKILTMTQQSQKILLNVPSVSKPVESLKRKLNETGLKMSSSNSNLVCLKLENFNDESNSSTSSNKNGFYDLNGNGGGTNKKIKLIEINTAAQNTVVNLIKTNSNSNLANSD